MKKVLVLMAGCLMLAVNLHAGNGDLIVNGNVGVGGVTNPQYPLDVIGTIQIRKETGMWSGMVNFVSQNPEPPYFSLYHNRTGGDPLRYAYIQAGDFNGTTKELRFATENGATFTFLNGNVGIGMTNPQHPLDVAGSVASNHIILSSDINFKKDILPLDAPLNKILALNGVSYEWKTDGEFKEKNFPKGRHYGVIAQEIEKVLPEVVSERPDGKKGVAYMEIIPVLIEAIKEQQKEINDLKSALRQLSSNK